MMRWLGKMGAVAALASMATPAQALICEVNFGGRLAISRDGALNVDFIGAGIVNICSMVNNDRAVNKDACAAWFSALLSFRLAKVRAILFQLHGR